MALSEALQPVFARKIAHRGLHDLAAGIVENTRSAFAAALVHGYGMECDIQPSADGEAMVFHDYTLQRLTKGTGAIKDYGTGYLRDLAFSTTADRMQTLGELLAQVAGREPLVVEIKSAFDGDTRITRRVAELVAGYAGPLVLKSFDPAMIIALRREGVRQPLGIVAMSNYEYRDYIRLNASEKRALANLLHFGESRPDFLSWNHRDLPAAAPFLCRSQLGLPVMSWTIRSALEAETAAPHIDQIVFEGFRPTA
jgi:glycerophosphoryl diester phosphodiesterase